MTHVILLLTQKNIYSDLIGFSNQIGIHIGIEVDNERGIQKNEQDQLQKSVPALNQNIRVFRHFQNCR